jgi:hypothetical protein
MASESINSGLRAVKKERTMDIKRRVLIGTTLMLAALLVACATARKDEPAEGGSTLVEPAITP